MKTVVDVKTIIADCKSNFIDNVTNYYCIKAESAKIILGWIDIQWGVAIWIPLIFAPLVSNIFGFTYSEAELGRLCQIISYIGNCYYLPKAIVTLVTWISGYIIRNRKSPKL